MTWGPSTGTSNRTTSSCGEIPPSSSTLTPPDTQILGTTGFAAPEQYGMSQSDSRADIYSVGVLINVMLTGEHPSKKLAPGHLGRVVEHCTRVNPAKRYKTVLRLVEAL